MKPKTLAEAHEELKRLREHTAVDPLIKKAYEKVHQMPVPEKKQDDR